MQKKTSTPFYCEDGGRLIIILYIINNQSFLYFFNLYSFTIKKNL